MSKKSLSPYANLLIFGKCSYGLSGIFGSLLFNYVGNISSTAYRCRCTKRRTTAVPIVTTLCIMVPSHVVASVTREGLMLRPVMPRELRRLTFSLPPLALSLSPSLWIASLCTYASVRADVSANSLISPVNSSRCRLLQL